MSDTLTAPGTPAAAPAAPSTPVAPGTPAPAASPIADAGAAFKTAESWADLGFPAVAGMDVTDGSETETPETPTPDAPATDATEFVQNEHGQWHRPDGTFANADEIKAIDAQLAADTAAAPKADEAKPDAANAENVVTLRRRDGTTRDVLVDDAELAQEIRQNMNDGMRRREYTERMAVVESKEAELREFQTMLRANPEGVILKHLPPEKQIAVATGLLAQHFDALVPIILQYDKNPGDRITAVTEAQATLRKQEGDVQTLLDSQQRSRDVRASVAALVPDSATDEQQRKFWKFATLELTAAVDAGVHVTKETAPQLLADLVAQFGFSGQAGATPATPAKPRISVFHPTASPASPTAPPAAQPVGDAAKALADAETVKATQKRLKLVQQARANAAAVPPVGAGAAPVRLPPVPKGATIEDASKRLRQLRSWSQ